MAIEALYKLNSLSETLAEPRPVPQKASQQPWDTCAELQAPHLLALRRHGREEDDHQRLVSSVFFVFVCGK